MDSHNFLKYLQDNYILSHIHVFWSETPLKTIKFNDTVLILNLGKKSVTEKIYSLEEDDWSFIGEENMKSIINKFLGLITQF